MYLDLYNLPPKWLFLIVIAMYAFPKKKKKKKYVRWHGNIYKFVFVSVCDYFSFTRFDFEDKRIFEIKKENRKIRQFLVLFNNLCYKSSTLFFFPFCL